VSFADSRPRVPNDTPEDRAKNRRIEIRLRPVETPQTAGAGE
jgi:flagellar motor protein MotB